jgi:serine/threonine-protein kinase
LSKLEHPHLARLTSFWLLDAQNSPVDPGDAATPPAAAVRLVLGERQFERTLLDRLAECRAEGQDGIPRDELLGYMLGLAQALDYLNAPQHAWAGGKVSLQHGQVRPQDLELHQDAQGLRVRLGNYLQSRLLDADSIILSKGGIRASHAYLAPELRQGHLSRWSDQYSLGVTYCHLRTGASPAGLADMVESSLDLSALPGPEATVLERATSPDLEQRFETCKEFVTELSMAVARARRPTRRSVQITGDGPAVMTAEAPKVEESKAEAKKSAPKIEPVQPEVAKAEPPKPEVKAEAAKAETAKAESPSSSQPKIEPAKTETKPPEDKKSPTKPEPSGPPEKAPEKKPEPAKPAAPVAKPAAPASPLIPSIPSIKSTVDFDEAFQMLLRESGSFPPPMPLNAPSTPALTPAVAVAAPSPLAAFDRWKSQLTPRTARILTLAVLCVCGLVVVLLLVFSGPSAGTPDTVHTQDGTP